jgi:hypothetical protein
MTPIIVCFAFNGYFKVGLAATGTSFAYFGNPGEQAPCFGFVKSEQDQYGRVLLFVRRTDKTGSPALIWYQSGTWFMAYVAWVSATDPEPGDFIGVCDPNKEVSTYFLNPDKGVVLTLGCPDP